MTDIATALDQMIGGEYRHGFVTELENDAVPRGTASFSSSVTKPCRYSPPIIWSSAVAMSVMMLFPVSC